MLHIQDMSGLTGQASRPQGAYDRLEQSKQSKKVYEL